MYAQLVRSRTTVQTCAEVHWIVADELIPEPESGAHLDPLKPGDLGLRAVHAIAGVEPGDGAGDVAGAVDIEAHAASAAAASSATGATAGAVGAGLN